MLGISRVEDPLGHRVWGTERAHKKGRGVERVGPKGLLRSTRRRYQGGKGTENSGASREHTQAQPGDLCSVFIMSQSTSAEQDRGLQYQSERRAVRVG